MVERVKRQPEPKVPLERLAKLEQSVVDHLHTCDHRYSAITKALDTLGDQLTALDSRISRRDFAIVRGLLGLLILLLISLTGYIWIDRVAEVDERMYRYVPSTPTPRHQDFSPLLSE